MRYAVAVCVAVAVGAGALLMATGPEARSTASQSLRITKLEGKRFERNGMRWVRLKATLCDSAPPKNGTLPSTIVTHFAIPKGTSRWIVERTAIDYPSYLMSLQESWGGRPCGDFVVEDPLTPDHFSDAPLAYGACYGASLTIVSEGRRAKKRVRVSCKPGWS
jgi:hypothetical protein